MCKNRSDSRHLSRACDVIRQIPEPHVRHVAHVCDVLTNRRAPTLNKVAALAGLGFIFLA
jgi:hypothetical protein